MPEAERLASLELGRALAFVRWGLLRKRRKTDCLCGRRRRRTERTCGPDPNLLFRCGTSEAGMLACERKKWLRERCRRIFRPNYAYLQFKQVWRAQKPNQRPLCSPWILKGTSIGNLNKPTGPGNNSCTKRLRLCRPCSPHYRCGPKSGPRFGELYCSCSCLPPLPQLLAP